MARRPTFYHTITLLPKTKKVFSLEKWLGLDMSVNTMKAALIQGWPLQCDGKTKEEIPSCAAIWIGTNVWVEVEDK